MKKHKVAWPQCCCQLFNTACRCMLQEASPPKPDKRKVKRQSQLDRHGEERSGHNRSIAIMYTRKKECQWSGSNRYIDFCNTKNKPNILWGIYTAEAFLNTVVFFCLHWSCIGAGFNRLVKFFYVDFFFGPESVTEQTEGSAVCCRSFCCQHGNGRSASWQGLPWRSLLPRPRSDSYFARFYAGTRYSFDSSFRSTTPWTSWQATFLGRTSTRDPYEWSKPAKPGSTCWPSHGEPGRTCASSW